MNYDYLTIVSVYGHNDGRSAIPALLESARQLPGSRGLLLSLEKPPGLPDVIDWGRVLPMNYRQYSLFMMFCLQHFVETSHCLVVQDDGWVLDGRNWRPEFLSFDYLGAPCHAAFVGKELIGNYRWVNTPGAVVIQNGGFSFRSRKYLEAPSNHGAMYHFSDREDALCNEDVQLTGIYRPTLESLGVRFAENSIAMRFAIEFLGPVIHDDLNFAALFGIHGKIRRLVAPQRVDYLVSKSQVEGIFGEKAVVSHLERLGYQVSFAGAG